MTADLERYRKNLRDEINGAALCTELAGAEEDPVRKDSVWARCEMGRRRRRMRSVNRP
jgi:hypothetical protein